MNIIALLESISLDKSNIGNFSTKDYTEIKKKLAAQQEINPKIEDTDIAALLKALKSYPDSLNAILNNRQLFNFFNQKKYPRINFPYQAESVDFEKAKEFIKLFLLGELQEFFVEKLEANRFEEINDLAEAKEYFPSELTFSIKQHLFDKLDNAIVALKPPHGNLSKVLYIKNGDFFVFLSHFNEDELEWKVKELSEAITSFYNFDRNSELANKTFVAMNNYRAIDSDFSQTIRTNRTISDSSIGSYVPKKRNLTWVYVAVGVFVIIRIIFFINLNKFNNHTYDDSTYGESTYEDIQVKPEPRKIDSYYTNMKSNIDSFQTFLSDFNESEIKQMTRDIVLKTGENPFVTFYKDAPAGESNNFITVKNKTGYDMVLLENTVLYDTIKMPRTAHFIKTGDVLEINFNSSDAKTIFNIYLGKKWATFQTESKHLFIRNHSVIEYRFSELIPDAKEILKTDYSITKDAVISYSNGGLDIDSENARINPLNNYK